MNFRSHHTTTLGLDLDDKYPNRDASKTVLRHFSAAFDTVDHSKLFDRLKKWEIVPGTVLNWFISYLQDSTIFMEMTLNMSPHDYILQHYYN